jgi:hypothetical protein
MVFGIKTIKIKRNLYLLDDKFEKSRIIDSEEYVKKRLKELGYNIKKSKRSNNIGVPDFFYEGNQKTKPFYIEVKTENDGLRFEQLLWISKNIKDRVYIYYVNKKEMVVKNKNKKIKKVICFYCNHLRECVKDECKKNICNYCELIIGGKNDL